MALAAVTFDGSIELLRAVHAERRSAIRSRLTEFAKVPREEYFYECVYCLLTPQSSAVNAGKAVLALREHDFQNKEINPEPLLHTKEYYIRFHKTKTKHLTEFKRLFPELFALLCDETPGRQVREWIVTNVQGMGWKEASHVLRNIGYRDLAILDRHILRNLVRAKVLNELPKTLTSKTYLSVEEKFLTFAQQLNIPMDELDLLFWSMETGAILK